MLFLRQAEPNIRRYLPTFIFSDKTADAIARANNSEHEALRLAVADVANQFYVETATWGLMNWERVLDIPTVVSDGYEARRKRILLKLQAHQTSTLKYMESLISRYSDKTIEIVEHNHEYWFEVIARGAIIDVVGMFEAINTYKPAHLGVCVKLKRKAELKYNIGILNFSIGRKQIGIPSPEATVIRMTAGVAHLKVGKKTIGLSPPPPVENKIYIGQYICRTGRITIGGIR